MKITFVFYNKSVFYNKGEKIFLWDWNSVNTIPRKDDLIELTALGYGDKWMGKFTIVQNVLWKDKDNIEITLEF